MNRLEGKARKKKNRETEDRAQMTQTLGLRSIKWIRTAIKDNSYTNRAQQVEIIRRTKSVRIYNALLAFLGHVHCLSILKSLNL